jgi:hypothetical protein
LHLSSLRHIRFFFFICHAICPLIISHCLRSSKNCALLFPCPRYLWRTVFSALIRKRSTFSIEVAICRFEFIAAADG